VGLDAELERLAADLDAAAVLRGGGLDRYGTPARGAPGHPDAVVRPADLEQVRTVVAWARGAGAVLVPQGANSGLVGASTPPPRRPDREARPMVVLSTERLRAGPVVDPVARTAVVGAGVRLSELNEEAAAHRLELPIDLGADPSLGGMVATNTGGSRMIAHGDLRAHLLGVRAVAADDRVSVVDELTTLRKHNVGPSLTQLLVGAGGAFAVVTDVAVSLERVPRERATAWMVPVDGPAAIAAVVDLEARGAPLSAYEVVGAHALEAARGVGPPGADPFGGAPAPELSVLVELSGDDVAERLTAELERLAADGRIRDAVVQPPTRAWSLRHRITEGLRARGAVLGLDVSVPRGSLDAFRVAARRVVARVAPEAEVADFGHWGDGGMHLNVVWVGGDEVPAHRRAELVDAVLALVVGDFGGSFSAEHGVGPHNAAWWDRTVGDGTRLALQGLAAALDPLGVLGHPGLPYRGGPAPPAATHPGTAAGGSGSPNNDP
jgi:FAD/FMN-containing dehydrogenase